MDFSTPTLLALRLLEEPELEEGETGPVKIECGSITDVITNNVPEQSVFVVKFKSKVNNNESGIVTEVISGHLARYFGIKIPRFAFVEITECFAQSMKDFYYPDYICTNINMNKHEFNFGSQLVDMTTTIPLLNEKYSDVKLLKAGTIFAFDALINNADRTQIAHNLFETKESFIIFDHEKAFASLTSNAIESENNFCLKRRNGNNFLLEHLLYPELKGKGCSFSNFIDKLESLDDDILNQITGELPYYLKSFSQPHISKIVDHIKHIRDHSKDFQFTLMKVLA